MTWAEIEITDDIDGNRRYEVSLWFYGEAAPRHSGAITVPAPQDEGVDRPEWKRRLINRLMKILPRPIR